MERQNAMLTLDNIPGMVEKQQAIETLGEERFERKSRAGKEDKGAFKNVFKKFTSAL
jgi:hypothetical protein